jgi:hypothetical protein
MNKNLIFKLSTLQCFLNTLKLKLNYYLQSLLSNPSLGEISSNII